MTGVARSGVPTNAARSPSAAGSAALPESGLPHRAVGRLRGLAEVRLARLSEEEGRVQPLLVDAELAAANGFTAPTRAVSSAPSTSTPTRGPKSRSMRSAIAAACSCREPDSGFEDGVAALKIGTDVRVAETRQTVP